MPGHDRKEKAYSKHFGRRGRRSPVDPYEARIANTVVAYDINAAIGLQNKAPAWPFGKESCDCHTRRPIQNRAQRPIHRTQAINYLLLAGLQHGRLVNFRTERLQYEFVSTTLNLEERRRFRVVADEWVEKNAASRRLRLKLIELLEDWGAFLDVNLYREGLVYFLGGANSVCKPVEILSGQKVIGTQNLNLLDLNAAFALTMKHRQATFMRDHLDRLLHHTSLKAIPWINLNHHLAEFITLR
jgi:hypothetical protein